MLFYVQLDSAYLNPVIMNSPLLQTQKHFPLIWHSVIYYWHKVLVNSRCFKLFSFPLRVQNDGAQLHTLIVSSPENLNPCVNGDKIYLVVSNTTGHRCCCSNKSNALLVRWPFRLNFIFFLLNCKQSVPQIFNLILNECLTIADF